MKFNSMKISVVLLLLIIFAKISHNKRLISRRLEIDKHIKILNENINDKVFLENIKNMKNLAKLEKYINQKLINFGKMKLAL